MVYNMLGCFLSQGQDRWCLKQEDGMIIHHVDWSREHGLKSSGRVNTESRCNDVGQRDRGWIKQRQWRWWRALSRVQKNFNEKEKGRGKEKAQDLGCGEGMNGNNRPWDRKSKSTAAVRRIQYILIKYLAPSQYKTKKMHYKHEKLIDFWHIRLFLQGWF